MKHIPLIFALLIVLCQIAPAIAANNKEVVAESTTKLEVKEASKDKVTVKEFISTASGDSKVKSKDIELKTEKLDKCLKISSTTKTKSKSVDSHDILVPVADIQNFNGHSVRITHFTDGGIQDNEYIQKVIVQDGYVLIPDVEFSSIIVDGFTGTYTKTIVGANITDFSTSFEGNYDSVHVSIPGADGEQMDENNTADYPDGAVGIWNFNGNSNDLLGLNNGTDTNATYSDNALIVNGIDTKVDMGDILNSDYSMSIYFEFERNGLSSSGINPGVISQRADGWGFVYVPNADNTLQTRIYQSDGTAKDLPVTTYTDDTKTSVAIVCDNLTGKIYQYVDGSLDSETVYDGTVQTGVDHFLVGTQSNEMLNGKVYTLLVYPDYALSSSEITNLYTSVNGTAARSLPNATWVPVMDGSATLPVDSTVSSIEVVDSDGGTYDVTATGSFTEDTTLISESETNGILDISIYKEYVNNATSGYLEYEPVTTNFTYNLSMASSDPNATAITHNQIINVSTGEHSSGDSFYYNFTLSTLESFEYTVNWISKSATKAVVEYNSSNSNVENDFYLENMSSSTLFEFKYSNGTVLVNSTSDSSGYLQFDDVTGLVNDTYTIETQAEKFPVSTFIISSFVAVVAGFFGLRFGNQRRKR